MSFPRLKIEDHGAFGKLILQWAKSPEGRPRTVGELVDQANKAGAGVSVIDGSFDDDVVHYLSQPDDGKLHIVLPHPDMATSIARRGFPGEEPDLPDFYDQAWRNGASTRQTVEDEGFRYARLAEYCTQKCM